MNFLAHAFLSFGHEEILVGNMVSDFVKGKQKFTFPEGIQKGITLHRGIDTFTDSHEATKSAKEIFKPHYRLYAGAFVDVAYDHFLASDGTEFSEESLRKFSETVYSTLGRFHDLLPERFARMFPYMRSQNWLFHYRTLEGAGSAFMGLVRRATYLTESDTAVQLFREHYLHLQQCYQRFIPDVKKYAHNTLEGMGG